MTIRFNLNGTDYLFDGIDGNTIHCSELRGMFERRPTTLSLFEVWRSSPRIYQRWGLSEYNFNDWESFAREQTWRLRPIVSAALVVRDRLRLKFDSLRKEVALERNAVLSAVNRLMELTKYPSSWAISTEMYGSHWADRADAMDKLDRLERMLEALVELKELKKHEGCYAVTGQGIATLSKYEEEERKHRESMGLQKGIRWLTFIMMIAALLQARVIEFKPLLTLKGPWPWQ
ncbi:hypothetical protein [Stenotrophomonas maltophilia]|uniref:hypothetical protein n=1 Tax=Stenotrophomonas maltophilia TaxID=40324 RepID=UPI002402D9BB|nr:hypothetical protein [Stenotrophomonas maltophilia]